MKTFNLQVGYIIRKLILLNINTLQVKFLHK